MPDTTKNEGAKAPRKTTKRTPVTSEAPVRGDILAGSKTNGRPPRTLLEPESTAPKRRAAKPKLTPAAQEAMETARRDIADAMGAGDSNIASAAQASVEAAKPAKARARKPAGSGKASNPQEAAQAEKAVTRAATKAPRDSARAVHSDADALVGAASAAIGDVEANIAIGTASDVKAAIPSSARESGTAMEAANATAYESANAQTLAAGANALANAEAEIARTKAPGTDAQAIAADATAHAADVEAAVDAIQGAPMATANPAKEAKAAAREVLKKLRATNEAAARAAKAAARDAASADHDAAIPASDAAKAPDAVQSSSVAAPAVAPEGSASKTVILPTDKAKKPSFAPPALTAAFLGADGEAITAIPEARGPKNPFGMRVTAKAAASVPGTVSVRFTLPAMLEPHIHDGQLDIVLKHNGEIVEGEAYLDWSQGDGKLDLHTRLVLKRGDLFEAILPMHTRAGALPENGLLVYGEFQAGTVSTDLPLMHIAAYPQRQAEVRASALLEAESGTAEPLLLPEDGRFTLSLRAQAVHASCNLAVELALPDGLAPVYIGASPVFLASLDGRVITTRGGLWDGSYDPAGIIRFTFYDIAPGKALELRLPLTATPALSIPPEGLALAPMLRIGDREEAMDAVHLLPGSYAPGEPEPKSRRRTSARPIAFCPLTQPM